MLHGVVYSCMFVPSNGLDIDADDIDAKGLSRETQFKIDIVPS